MNYYNIIKLIIFIIPVLGLAGDGSFPHLSGEDLGVIWVIAFCRDIIIHSYIPLVAPHFWHQNFGVISLFWAVSLIVPFIFNQGIEITLYELLHVGLLEYVPFIILLLALFTISGGVCFESSLVGTPILNTGIIFIGTALASWMGTTGAAMLLIRPLIRANAYRKNKVHIMVFLYISCCKYWWFFNSSWRPPTFSWFFKRNRFLLDNNSYVFTNVVLGDLSFTDIFLVWIHIFTIKRRNQKEMMSKMKNWV